MRDTRTGDGFPEWEIVTGSESWFGYPGTVTELRFDIAGDEWHIAVHDRSRRVIRAAVGTATGVWRLPNLNHVPGLVRRFYGASTYGHTDYFVARDTTGVRV